MQARLLKEIVELVLAMGYAVFLLLVRRHPSRVVMYYHSVKERDTRQFEKQMAYLANKCRVVQASEIRTVPAEGTESLVALTFDDAFVSVLENAVPILKRHGLTAGFFVPAGNMGQQPRWRMSDDCADRNETVMSPEQIAELYNEGFEIFSHTASHLLLTEIDENRLNSELLESKEKLEKVIGREVLGISYPYGGHDATVCNAAKRAGYNLGFTNVPEVVDCSPDDMRIGRFAVSPGDGMLKFRLKVKGAYRMTKHLQSLKRFLCTGWRW